MDKTEAMRVFTRVVERRSFTLAAQDLGLPRSTVTEAVQALEARLGTKLLQRTTRHVAPTLDGEAYHRRCLAILADIEDAEAGFGDAKPRGLLRVDVHGTLARHFMLPGLPQFLARYPELQLHIGEGDRLVDLVREGVDCVLRVGEPQDSAMVGRRIATLEEAVCASPEYLHRHGAPQTPDELDGHRMIGFVSSVTGSPFPLEFLSGQTIRRITLPTTVSVASADTNVAAARLGLGLIQVPRYRLEEDFAAGTLVEVLKNFPGPARAVSLLYLRDRQLSPRVRVFIDWLSREFAQRLAKAP